MLHKKFLLFFLLFFFSLKAFPAVFVVTSNADSGPGTLRDALTQAAANGSATMDYINFNLPDLSEAGRTITINSSLPYVSSNIVIDGTNQPGGKFGRSDASIVLQPANQTKGFNALILLDADGVQIYGLYVRDFNGPIYYSDAQGVQDFAAAVYIETSSNVQLGAPGKGNVFVNNGFTVTTIGPSLKDRLSSVLSGVTNLKFYSNIVGFEPDGKTYRGTNVYYNGGGLQLNFCGGDIRIGDDNIDTRNIFGNGVAILNAATGASLHPSTILIKNNYFNYDIDGNPAPIININASEVFSIFIAQSSPLENLDYPYTVDIINNRFLFPYSVTSGHITGDFIMQGNQLLNDPKQLNPGYEGGIGATADGNVLIGGLNPGEANVLYGEEVDLFSRKSLLLQHNSIYCMSDFRGVWYPSVPYLAPPLPLPVVDITSITVQSISGTATPLSNVELFWDDDCYYCEPQTYVTTVQADNNGNWSYNGPVKTGVVASAELNGFTSVFTKHAVYEGGNVIHAACGNNGSISGGVFQNTGGYRWKNSSGTIIGSKPDINNLAPGSYTLTALNGTCSRDYTFTIFDATPKINDQSITLIPPSCGNDKGSITGIYVDNYDVIYDAENRGIYNAYTYKWMDASGTVVGTSSDLTNVPAGTYHLEVSYMGECAVPYGPVILKNVSGPNIDQSNPAIQPTNCGQSTGSITNLAVTGTGTLRYIWWNSQQQTVGTTKDLLGQPAGTYKLEVTDDSQCGPVYTTDITIPETNGITMDETKAASNVASCSKNNGSITGIVVTGATKYVWTDAAGHSIITVDPDFLNVAPGDYTLIASNTSGCSKSSRIYHVGQDPPTQYPVYASTVVPTCFGKSNGSVSVATDLLVSSARWIDSQGAPIGGSSAQLTDVPAGTYQLFVTDKNGCENLYNSYTVTTIPQLQILPGSEKIIDDQCTLHTGSISNIQVSGGLPPYTWSWLDANNKIVSSSADLNTIGAGLYTLNVNDASGCGLVSASYTVQNQTDNIPAPAVSNLLLCSAGDALLQVSNPSTAYSYRLYDSQTGTTPVDEQANGNFKITVKSNTTYYISQVSGDCESPRSAVQVSVGITAVDIANAFTPNGDGINDYWVIKGISSYSSAIVQVFTRNGQKVFESIGYPKPFDGTYSGKQLPSGVYYYIINLKSNCNLLSGSLTIIR